MTTYRFMDGVSGRPGAGSSSGVVLPSGPSAYSGDYGTGIVFSVTGGGRWLDGYWWYVPLGGQTTSGATFALWEAYSPAAGLFVTGSAVTAGTLTAATSAGNANGWNYIPLSTPLQLTPNVVYQATIAYNSTVGFPQQKNVFGSGDTFSAGITNSWATAYSSSGGSNPATGPGGTLLPQMPYQVSGTNASTIMPTINDADDILWIDVQLDDTPPSVYTTRLWPNYPYVYGMFANSVDSEFTLCNEFDISAGCTLQKLWFYSPQGPPAATVLPTECGIFSIATGLNVPGSLVTSPSWSGAAGSGWVSVTYTGGLPLGAGYYLPWVTYAGGNPWYGTIVNYYTTGQGASGITNGIVTAPPNSGAHGPSQGTYSTSFATYPNVVVTNGENYFVDLEVTVGGFPGTGGAVVGRRGRKGRTAGSPPPLVRPAPPVPPVASGTTIRGRAGRKGRTQGSPQPLTRIEEFLAATGATVRGKPGRKGKTAGSPAPLIHLEDTPPVSSGTTVRGRPGRRGTAQGSPRPGVAAAVEELLAATGALVRGRKARKGTTAGSPAPLVHVEDVAPVASGTSVRGRRGRKGTAAGSSPIPVRAAPPVLITEPLDAVVTWFSLNTTLTAAPPVTLNATISQTALTATVTEFQLSAAVVPFTLSATILGSD